MLSPAELQKFEAPLIALANQSGGDLRKLFYAFFSFLNRRTDFYCILPNDGSAGGRMGFQEGQAEQILLASFRQFPLRKVGPKPAGGSGGVAAKTIASGPAASKNQAPVKKQPPAKSAAIAEKQPVVASKPKVDDDSKKDNKAAKSTKSEVKEKSAKSKTDTIRYTEEGKQIPVGNGGSTSRYVWTQTLEEVTVHVPIPEGLRGKELDVKIGASSLSIRQKGTASSDSTALTPIEGTLFAKIRPSESTWTIESTTHSSEKATTLQLILDKVQKTWWATVLSGDTPLIDTTMVDSARHIGTYDDETQGQIRRILFDQRQERLGLPTSQKVMPPLPGMEDVGGALPPMPDGVEYIDGETLEKASISKQK